MHQVRQLWRFPAFRWLLVGRTTVMLGNAVAPVALAFAVLDLTGSVRDLGLVVGARSAANVLTVLFGGVLADRLPRALVLRGSATASALTQAAVAAVVLSGYASIAPVLVLSFVNGAVVGLGMPAAMALTPQTVPAQWVRQANAVLRLGASSAMIGGAAAGGMLVAGVGPGWGIVVDAAAFAVAAGCFARIRLSGNGSERPVAGEREHPLRSLREGWSEFVSRTWVWVVVAQFSVLNAAISGGFAVLGPVVADATMGRRAWGLVLAANTAGMVVGGLLALRWQPRRALAFGVGLMLCEAVPLLLLGLAPLALLLGVAMFLAGVAVEQFAIAWDVSLQQNVPTDRLSRVYSYDALGSFVAIPLGQVAVAPLAAAFGVRSTLIGCAVLVVVPTLLALLSRSVRTLQRDDRDDRDDRDGLAA